MPKPGYRTQSRIINAKILQRNDNDDKECLEKYKIIEKRGGGIEHGMKPKIKISLATKFAAIFAVLFLLVMLAVTFVVRQTIVSRFTSHYQRDMASTLRAIQQHLNGRRATLINQLQQLAARLSNDTYFRLYAILLKDPRQGYVRDYAKSYVPTMELQALEIMDKNGLVLSSRHNSSDVGQMHTTLLHQLQTLGAKSALAWLQRANGTFLALSVLDSAKLGTEKFYFIAGVEITSDFLREFQRDTTEIVILPFADAVFSTSPQRNNQVRLAQSNTATNKFEWPDLLEKQFAIGNLALPVISSNSIEEASLFLLRPKSELKQLLDGLNRRIFIVIGIGVIVAVVLSIWQIRAVARPLQRLANTAGDLSLEKLDVEFEGGGNDEVGVLSEAMRNMVQRLRQSRFELAVAEQKAALVEVARQVNHDIKNGFIPIRNVMQHWMEVAESESEKLTQIFNERKTTVLESLDYLENLARNYSRLRPKVRSTTVPVNRLVLDVLKNYHEISHRRIQFQTRLDSGDPCVQADTVQLRRAFENVLRNAVEAICDSGTILVSTEMNDEEVCIIWADTGSGIPQNIRQQLFVTQVTTKPDGTGLGLANVKRIVEDFGGAISIQSEAGSGTTVRLQFPRANGATS